MKFTIKEYLHGQVPLLFIFNFNLQDQSSFLEMKFNYYEEIVVIEDDVDKVTPKVWTKKLFKYGIMRLLYVLHYRIHGVYFLVG